MMRQGLISLVCALVLLVPCTARADRRDESDKKKGKIEKTRERMKQSSKSSTTSTRGRRAGRSVLDDPTEEEQDDSLEQLVGKLFGLALSSPFWVPAVALEDRPFPRPFSFYSFPYQQLDLGPHELELRPGPWDVLVRAQASYERHSDGIVGQRLHALLRTNRRLNLEAEITRYDEDLGASVDHLWHYKVLLTYSMAISQRAHFSAGLGVRGMRFAAGDHSIGFAGRYAVEVFPIRPLHVWTYAELGANSSALATELGFNVGALLYRGEAFIGYRYFRIVGISYAGPQAGLAVWF